MTLEQELQLSHYREVAPISPEHGVTLVQDIRDRKFYVKKKLTVYHPQIYCFLMGHPIRHTPRIRLLAQDAGILTVIEEYIPGSTLQELLEQRGAFSEAEALNITVQLCRILEDFHGCQPPIVNRDIKPSNIMLTDDAIVKLLDVNAAKWDCGGREQDTVLLGTQGYAAPEQYGFGASSVQTDVYAVGVLLRELLTGPGGPAVPLREPVSRIIGRCTQLNPGSRYGSMRELRQVLEALQQNRIPEAASGGWRRFLPPGFRSNNPVGWFFALAGYAVLLSLCLTLQVDGAGPGALLANRITLTAISVAIVLFSGNYLNVQQHFFLSRSKHPLLRLLGILAADAAIVFIGITALALLMPSAM